jgi:hypothetical protein
LSPEIEKYYENYFDLFITEGWKQLIEEVNQILESHDIDSIKDEKELALLQGERATLKRVASFETNIRNSYDHILENENDSQV